MISRLEGTRWVWIVAAIAATMGSAGEPRPPSQAWTTSVLIRRVPPLRNDASGRLPLIAWEPFRSSPEDRSFERAEPLPDEVYRELAARGLTQALPLSPRYVEMGKALVRAGARVVVMEGREGNGPGGDDPGALHLLPVTYTLAEGEPRFVCPLELLGWRSRAEWIRDTAWAYHDAGVPWDAVWLDWEIEPLGGRAQWLQARSCERCRRQIPPTVLDDADRYRDFVLRLRTALLSAYVAAPILEVFPSCSITNWSAVFSGPDEPTPSAWGDRTIPPGGLGLLTAANPVAYGNTIYYELAGRPGHPAPPDAASMEAIYTRRMLAQISHNERQARRLGPEKGSVPWVSRWCPDDEDPSIPPLSHERYREILRHLWLRGADAMQIFNPYRPETGGESSVLEVLDAVSVHDEMLAHRDLLERGTVLNVAVPRGDADSGVIWSGLATGDDAVVRAFSPTAKGASIRIRPWPDASAVRLAAPPEGRTYRLRRVGSRVRIVGS